MMAKNINIKMSTMVIATLSGEDGRGEGVVS